MDSLTALTRNSLAPVSLANSAALATARSAVGEQSVPTTMVWYMAVPRWWRRRTPFRRTPPACTPTVEPSSPVRTPAVCAFAHGPRPCRDAVGAVSTAQWSKKRNMSAQHGPGLAGLRVVECGQGVSAAYATKMLADVGADVVKVEPPNGDVTRRRGPFPDDRVDIEASGLFTYL